MSDEAHDERMAATAKIASKVIEVLDDPAMGLMHEALSQGLYAYGRCLKDSGLGPREVLNQLVGLATCTFCDSDLKDDFDV